MQHLKQLRSTWDRVRDAQEELCQAHNIDILDCYLNPYDMPAEIVEQAHHLLTMETRILEQIIALKGG